VPIIIQTPLPGQPTGPGFQVEAYNDDGLSMPPGSYWDFDLYPAVGEQQLSHARIYETGYFSNGIMGMITPSAPLNINVNVGTSTVAVGDTVRLVVRQVAAPSTIHDQTSINVVWEPTAAVQYLVMQQLKTMTAGTTGGFTEADRAELQVVKASVTADFGEGIIRGIGQLLTNLPPSLFGKTPIPPPRTGSGRLSNPVGPVNTAAAGLAWVVTDRKLGLGIDEGAPDRVELNILEVRYIDRLADATEYTSQHLESAELSGAWIWGFAPPYALEYWIIPGVTIQFYWLQPGFPPNWQTDEAGARQIMRDWRP